MKTASRHVKQTFLNLSPEKRERIIRESVREFAVQGYQQASINTLVRRLGIAKGSIYQYFGSKEALFFFVFERFTDLVKQVVREKVAGAGSGFWEQVRAVLRAGIEFIEASPDYFQIYLKVLFESEVPRREELIAQVRLFSLEYFGPLCAAAQRNGELRPGVPPETVVFVLDALLDRFLTSCAAPYLDGGLALAGRDRARLAAEADTIIEILKNGLRPAGRGEQ